MPETPAEANYHPSIVGNAFMRQYYQLLAKEPQSLHRFYKDESLWSHTTGSHMQEPIAGQKAINEQIIKRAYTGARVDLDIGSIDCQGSLNGGVFVLVTGVMTLVDSIVPKPFVQTFFLATQPNGYFVLNDCLRFLELPGASTDAAAAPAAAPTSTKDAAATDAKKPQAAIGTPVAQSPASSKTAAKLQASPIKTTAAAAPAAVASPAAKKHAAPASPAAKPTPAAAAAASSPKPSTSKAPAPQSPVKAAPAAPKSAPRDASPVKKATGDATAQKPTATPATAASPKASSASSAAALSPTAKPAAAPKAPVSAPAVPAAPMSWASRLFSAAPSAPASAAAAKPSPALASVVGAASTAAKPTPAAVASPKPSKSTTDAPPASASTSTGAAPTSAPKERTRYHSLFIKDVPSQTKDTDLRELFKSYGAIAGVTVVANRNYAFVDFYDAESQRAALAETNDLKVHDTTLLVEERTDRKDVRSGGRGFDTTRGGRFGGRGFGGRSFGGRTGGNDSKFRDDFKDRRAVTGENSASAANGNSSSSIAAGRGPSAPRSDRRDKGGRRGGKVDGAVGARVE